MSEINLAQVQNSLTKLPGRIAYQAEVVNEANRQWKLKKAEFENEFSRALLITRAKEPDKTVQEVKATATNNTYTLRLDVIEKEAEYHRERNKLNQLVTEMDSAKELAYNLRAEMKHLDGTIRK